MKTNKIKNIFLFLILFASFEAHSKTTNVLKLSCEYDPKLIKKQTTNIDSSESSRDSKVSAASLFKQAGSILWECIKPRGRTDRPNFSTKAFATFRRLKIEFGLSDPLSTRKYFMSFKHFSH